MNTLNDAALLSKVVLFVANSSSTAAASVAPVTPTLSASAPTAPESVSVEQSVEEDDLSDLADPIPLKPKEV